AYPPADEGSNESDGVVPLLEATSTAASLIQVDHGEPQTTESAEAIVMSLGEAARTHPGLVEKHLGTVVSSEDPFVAHNEATLAGGAFVYVPRDTQLKAPILLTAIQSQQKRSLNWRTLIVLEEGAEA